MTEQPQEIQTVSQRKCGRPTVYTPQIIEEICHRLSEGEPLEVICRDDHMPGSRTIRKWLIDGIISVPSIKADIARARELGYDAIACQTREIARGGVGSTGDVARDRLIIETDLKLLAKWHHRKYGDNKHIDIEQKIEHTAKLSSSELTNDQLIEALRKADADGMLPPDVKLLNNGDVVVAEYEEIEPVKESEDEAAG